MTMIDAAAVLYRQRPIRNTSAPGLTRAIACEFGKQNVMQLRLLRVCVGRPQIIAHVGAQPVFSAIAKHPVTGNVFVGKANIDGDAQADLTVHGGFDKAIYAYPADNWPWWESQQMLPCSPNTFGENLTLEGADESQISIGDRFVWGDAELEVSQPRGPCYKLAIHTRRANTPAIMTVSARSGWYLRVTREGEAPPHGTLIRIHASGAPNVRDAFMAAYHPHVPESDRVRVLEVPELAENWRMAVARKLTAP
ncbi:MAG TPA: MOSC domain-containing protein [Rhizomicrobium sp.]|jgi:MOSC domain-containing protein YiiM